MLPINAAIDAVNQGNWSLSIKLRLDTFVNVEKYYSFSKAPAYSFAQLQNKRLLTMSICLT